MRSSFLVDPDINLLRLRKHGDGGPRGMDAAARLGFRARVEHGATPDSNLSRANTSPTA